MALQRFEPDRRRPFLAYAKPEQFSWELAIERPWAIVLAAGAGVLALLMVAPWPTGSDRVVRREHYARPVQQD